MGERENFHSLTLDGRKKLTMTGVTEVVSFDDGYVVLRTELGMLTVQGTGLRLKTLSTDGGQMAVTGEVSALSYEEPRESGWLRRIFGCRRRRWRRSGSSMPCCWGRGWGSGMDCSIRRAAGSGRGTWPSSSFPSGPGRIWPSGSAGGTCVWRIWEASPPGRWEDTSF